jgi:hypothetical protein
LRNDYGNVTSLVACVSLFARSFHGRRCEARLVSMLMTLAWSAFFPACPAASCNQSWKALVMAVQQMHAK